MTQTELVTEPLDGKIAVITGGNSGIGLATAQRFVQEGAYVFITGRRQSERNKAVKQIGKLARIPSRLSSTSFLTACVRYPETLNESRHMFSNLFYFSVSAPGICGSGLISRVPLIVI
jgi:NAD(P)-dependent dehydrogenase (short-subunit alcohol dehydrogenase family)